MDRLYVRWSVLGRGSSHLRVRGMCDIYGCAMRTRLGLV